MSFYKSIKQATTRIWRLPPGPHALITLLMSVHTYQHHGRISGIFKAACARTPPTSSGAVQRLVLHVKAADEEEDQMIHSHFKPSVTAQPPVIILLEAVTKMQNTPKMHGNVFIKKIPRLLILK